MPTTCIIGFTDVNREERAHILRKQQGHPEEIVSNLASLNTVLESHQGELSPGDVATQFLFMDILWYALQEVRLGDIEDHVMTLLY